MREYMRKRRQTEKGKKEYKDYYKTLTAEQRKEKNDKYLERHGEERATRQRQKYNETKSAEMMLDLMSINKELEELQNDEEE